ncbi:MAG TPA: Stp1/IreP family PP2C-type Ser/Thr phosphatase [Solirubrobacterales bacterium]|nr:Stp1/IreP family PP2C-type Ser/Thr phosphatase [Solirubrobacterales bacterium]
MLRVADAAQRTDTGRQREANEDSYFARAPVFVVADGMGGAQAGEVASRIAVDAFEPEVDAAGGPEAFLRQVTEQANRQIFEFAQGDRSRSGMGTTLTAALVSGDEVSFGHVGDSRAYRFRDGELTQLTNDHSLVEELRRQGKLTREQAAEHPQRSVITRALGPEPEVIVDTMTVQARPGDLFLLCSDGLTTMLSDADVAATLAHSEDLDTAARRLVRAANDHGGRDNITVVLFRLEASDVAAAGEEPTAAEPAEGATLVGVAAAEAGFTAEAVREGAAERGSAPVVDKPVATPGGQAERRGPWRGRIFRALAVLAVLAVVIGGAYYGARQVWFIGADEAGRVTLYRGLPYELPFGADLFEEVYSSPITVEALPEDRRETATNHELRSRDDAVSLIEDLRLAAEEQAVADRPPERNGGGSQGGRSGGRGSGSGGGSGGGNN